MIWFRAWVRASEGIVWAQQRLIDNPPRNKAKAIVRLQLALWLSWWYHRCLDMAELALY